MAHNDNPGRRRVQNGLSIEADRLLVALDPAAGIDILDPATQKPISLESIHRVMQMLLREQRITNLLLLQLKDPGATSLTTPANDPDLGAH